MNQIDILQDEVLLEIFDFYVDPSFNSLGSYEGIPSDESKKAIEEWQSLVHVCRRWRHLVFQSPRRLNLRLYCTPKTPIRDRLDVWPALPLIVDAGPAGGDMGLSKFLLDPGNIAAALGQSNRICQVDLHLAILPRLEEVLAAMQVPFPELTHLRVTLLAHNTDQLTIPDSFLDGSAPRLQYLKLNGFSFPGLPNLLSSATHLVELRITDIPYIWDSSEAVVALISVLSCLRILSLEFDPFASILSIRQESRSTPLQKRSTLPALVKFYFKGDQGYLEDIVTRIDTPQLDEVDVFFFFAPRTHFDCPLLAQLINRSPTLRTPDEAHASLQFDDHFASITLLAQSWTIKIRIQCAQPVHQLPSVARICNSPLHPLSAVEDLHIVHRHQQIAWWIDTTEKTLWLRLFLPFTAVKNLYLSKEFEPGIAAALQELVGARSTEVLPSLRNIFVKGLEPSGQFQENIGQFVAARQLSDHPIAISIWDEDSNMETVEPM